MAHGALAVRTSNTTTGAATWELRTAATDRAYVEEIGIFIAAATASTFGIGRPAAIGVTPTAPITLLPYDIGDPMTATIAIAWGTGPTIPANFMRRISIPAAIGNGIILQFAFPGLVIPVSSSLIIWNLTATSAADIYVTTRE
jgi:hypothetical protein